MKRMISVMLLFMFISGNLIFAGGASETEEPGKEIIEYSVLDLFDESASEGYNNPDDTVTPIVEDMWGIKLGEVIFTGGMNRLERVNMLVAAGNLPDVVKIDAPNIFAAYETGAFADLTDLIDKMPNLDKYISDAGYTRLTYKGKVIAISGSMSGGRIDVDNPEVAKEVEGDLFFQKPQNWALAANENILRQAGYTFKSIAELQAELDENPRTLTEDDYAIYPKLETAEDLEELLYKIQSLNLKANGQDVIPLSIPDWAAYHVSILNAPNPGWWANPETGEVSGYLNNPGMKDFYQTWTKWYKDGVLDKNYLIHKGEQYQEKVAMGRVALCLPAFDLNAVRDSLKDEDPNNDMRPIPWPESAKNNTIDAAHPAGFEVIMFNKDFEHTAEIMEYFDWFQTLEAQELLSWGPESNGIWEEVNGVKQFKDEALWEAIRDGKKTADGKDGLSYGIEDINEDGVLEPSSRAALGGPGILYNRASLVRSYPFKQDAYQEMWREITTHKLNFDGTALPSMGEESSFVGGYYWGTTRTTKIAELLSTGSDAEFNQVWDAILEDFELNGHYSHGLEEMKAPFAQSLGK